MLAPSPFSVMLAAGLAAELAVGVLDAVTSTEVLISTLLVLPPLVVSMIGRWGDTAVIALVAFAIVLGKPLVSKNVSPRRSSTTTSQGSGRSASTACSSSTVKRSSSPRGDTTWARSIERARTPKAADSVLMDRRYRCVPPPATGDGVSVVSDRLVAADS